MKITILLVLLFPVTVCNTQVTHVWKACKSSQTNAWDCADNWSTHMVPGPDAHVLIPENPSHPESYPVISKPGYMVNTLQIEPGAKVIISYGASLTILNPDYCDDVGRIKVYGKLELPGTSLEKQEPLFATFKSCN